MVNSIRVQQALFVVDASVHGSPPNALAAPGKHRAPGARCALWGSGDVEQRLLVGSPRPLASQHPLSGHLRAAPKSTQAVVGVNTIRYATGSGDGRRPSRNTSRAPRAQKTKISAQNIIGSGGVLNLNFGAKDKSPSRRPHSLARTRRPPVPPHRWSTP